MVLFEDYFAKGFFVGGAVGGVSGGGLVEIWN